MLLNRARFTSRRGLPFKASALTSPPMCSPSRSQSVQMNRALALLARVAMFVDMGILSYKDSEQNLEPISRVTHLIDHGVHWSSKESFWRRPTPILILRPKRKACQVTRYSSHHNLTVSPRRSEVESKFVVLDVLVSCVLLQHTSAQINEK